jgi:hypothetical protein
MPTKPSTIDRRDLVPTVVGNRRLLTVPDYAVHAERHFRTVGNYLTKRLIPGYRLDGNPRSEVYIDMDEADGILRRLPSKVARSGSAAYKGANISTLIAQAEPLHQATG